ncbi:nuclear transport factor 2 family protein [Algoriphagus sp. SE2]|uniref:YybH family protein n=1 Tax=Algoriphagus sp. SE2 TaxID=3141536 RepID=UPI0031CCDAB4
MKTLLTLFTFYLIFSFSSIAQTSNHTKEDSQAILNLINSYSKSRDTKDTVLLKKILTKDIDQLVSSGVWRSGIKEAIAGMMQSSTSNPGERTLHVEKIRFLGEEVALVDARYEIKNADGSIRKMWSSFMVVDDGKSWRISAIRNMLPAGN